jgi:uncharacterized membrane protein
MKQIALYIMSLLYTAAGIYHFVKPRMYMHIMPAWLPAHLQLVYISGAAEIVLGLLLIPAATRALAAWGIILLLVAVFPANIQMMLYYYKTGHPMRWVTVARLPLQAVLIWWAWLYTGSGKF